MPDGNITLINQRSVCDDLPVRRLIWLLTLKGELNGNILVSLPSTFLLCYEFKVLSIIKVDFYVPNRRELYCR